MLRHGVRILYIVTAVLLWPKPALPAEPYWPDSLIIGTAAPGGTYAVYGERLASILSRELGIPVSARHTDGPNENIALLEAGEIQLAFVTLGVALQAWNGTGAWTGGKPFRTMRAIFPMYDSPFQFVVPQASDIQSVAQLSGKRVGVGPQGGTTSTYVPSLFRTLKIDAALSTGDWLDLVSQVQARSVDALVVAAGAPFPSLLELGRKDKVRFLPLTDKQVLDLRLAMPELGASVIASGTYASMRTKYQTVGLFNFAVARQDLPEDLVYAIVEVVFANQESLIEAHPAAAGTIPANFTRNTFLPFHSGSSRWYHKTAPGLGQGE
jgi:uncharacterized protein